MKRKIYLGLLVLTLCFLFGGSYLVLSINSVIDNLENIIVLQKVEYFRKNFQNNIAIVQTDLLLKDSPHARNIEVIVRHGEELEGAVSKCYSCHHEPAVILRLDLLKGEIDEYKKRLSRAYTIRANRERLEIEKQLAFNLGQQIMDDIKTLVIASSEKTAHKIAQVQNEVADTRRFILIFIAIGPILILLTTTFFLRRFTGSVSTLIQASRKLKDGDLNYRISKNLKDEFQELAVAFNEMAISLNDQCQRLHSAQKRYRMLFESAGDAIFVLEAEGENPGRIISANLAAAEMHGYTVDELLELKIQDLDTEESAREVPERLERLLAGEWINIIVDHRRKDGSIFPVEASGGMFEVDGHRYILAFDRDITERVKTEQALQRTKQMAMVGQTAAGLAHEIKNPLAGIKVSMEVLASELDINQEDREVFLRIVAEINRIEKLLKNMLNYARPPEPQFDRVDLNQLVEHAIKNAQFSLRSPAYLSHQNKAIQFEKALQDDLPPLLADSAQLQQVLLNLLLNAIEAIPEAGTITVTSRREEGHVRITIADTGKGIEEERLEEIFNPFFTTKSKGSGLGLAISKRLIEQHQGSLTARNNPDGGAAFIILLPLGAKD
jgi:two-component system, NtrC family, sensor histidine kinase AtoS